ncbi:MAG: STAS domain-containing protein [Spirochaetaceae bacterium]|jgi:anti-sigma B factor antagonist|nr:STAS domain-containing protein [Spirochaetaceae bacterium]
MEITKTTDGTKLILAISGKLSAATAEECNAQITDALKESKDIVLDLKDLDYLASAGLRVFVSTQKALAAEGGSLVLKNVQDIVREVFEVTGLEDVFTIE